MRYINGNGLLDLEVRMLNYKNDSMLLDGETANDLIENGRGRNLFVHDNFLNLFTAFVKKEDFV